MIDVTEIRAIPLFRDAPAHAKRARELRRPDHATRWKSPDAPRGARPRVLHHQRRDRRRAYRDGHVVAELGPGEFFGEIALLGDPHRTATVVATSDVDLTVLARREFRTMLSRFPEIASTILATASRRLAADIRLTEAA